MTVPTKVITTMANVKVKRKKALAMEQSTVSIQLNLLTEFASIVLSRVMQPEQTKWLEETKLIKKELFA